MQLSCILKCAWLNKGQFDFRKCSRMCPKSWHVLSWQRSGERSASFCLVACAKLKYTTETSTAEPFMLFTLIGKTILSLTFIVITIYFHILHLWRVVWRQNYFCESIKMNQPVISIQNVYLRVLHKTKFQLVGLSESADCAEWLFLAIKTLFNMDVIFIKKKKKKCNGTTT